jgi:hypothetical protein
MEYACNILLGNLNLTAWTTCRRLEDNIKMDFKGVDWIFVKNMRYVILFRNFLVIWSVSKVQGFSVYCGIWNVGSVFITFLT